MKNIFTVKFNRYAIFAIFFGTLNHSFSQEVLPPPVVSFWDKVQFGGGIGLGFGGNFTNVGLSPTMIYKFTDKFSLGAGVQGSYVASKDVYKSTIFGGSIIGLFNPAEEVQLSGEIEQLNVNRTFDQFGNIPSIKENFWAPALFLGAGYNMGGVVIGGRYNLLQNNKSAYSTGFMPFVRAYF